MNQMAVADIHSAGKTGPAVCDQQLAVIAKVDVKGRRNESGRDKTGRRNFFLAQLTEDGWKRVQLAEAVDEHPDLNAPCRGALKGFDKAIAR